MFHYVIITHALQASLYLQVQRRLCFGPYVSVEKSGLLFVVCFSDEVAGKLNAVQHVAQTLTDNAHLKMSA